MKLYAVTTFSISFTSRNLAKEESLCILLKRMEFYITGRSSDLGINIFLLCAHIVPTPWERKSIKNQHRTRHLIHSAKILSKSGRCFIDIALETSCFMNINYIEKTIRKLEKSSDQIAPGMRSAIFEDYEKPSNTFSCNFLSEVVSNSS